MPKAATSSASASVVDVMYYHIGKHAHYSRQYIITTGCRKPADASITSQISYWNGEQNRRYTCRTGKFLRKFFSDMDDNQIEQCQADINTELFAEVSSTIKVVKGEAIKKAYLDTVGGGSCMTHDWANDFLDIYADCPNVSLAMAFVEKGNSTVSARSLIWDAKDFNHSTCEYDSPVKYGDRIYYTSPEARNVLQDWQDANCDKSYGDEEECRDLNLRVEYSEEPTFYPYTDSFRYIDPHEQAFYTDEEGGGYWADSCNGALGEYAEGKFKCCRYCDERYAAAEMYTVPYITSNGVHPTTSIHVCQDCFDNRMISCTCCDERVHEDSAHYHPLTGEALCLFCFSTQARSCGRCGTGVIEIDTDHYNRARDEDMQMRGYGHVVESPYGTRVYCHTCLVRYDAERQPASMSAGPSTTLPPEWTFSSLDLHVENSSITDEPEDV